MIIDKTDKSLASLLSDLTRDTVDLVRQELELARAEMTTKIAQAQTALTSVAIGGAILLAGAIILLQALVKGFEMMLPEEVGPWLSPLIIGLIVTVVGYMLLKGGTAKLTADNLMPHKTMNSLKRDKTVVEERMQ
jgi:hypothetical protein